MLRIRRLLGLPEPSPEERVFGEEEIEAARVDAAVPRRRARARRRSPRSRACSARGWRGWPRPPRPRSSTRSWSPGDSEDEVAERFATLAEQLTPAIDPVLRGSLQAAPGRERPARDAQPRRARGRRGGRRAGDHRLLRGPGRVHAPRRARSRPRSSAAVASKLAELANDVTEPPVRLVKTIGDAAMFVSPDPAALVSVALSLLEAVEAADLPSLRAGSRARARAPARRRLLRPRGQPRQPRDRGRAPGQRPVHAGGPRRRRRPVRLVVRAQAQAQGHVRAGPALPRRRLDPDGGPEESRADDDSRTSADRQGRG